VNQQQREARNAALGRIGKDRAKLRACPACGRGNALRRHVDLTGHLGSVTTCRWCPFERTYVPVLGAASELSDTK
jgi:hypothetical protein